MSHFGGKSTIRLPGTSPGRSALSSVMRFQLLDILPNIQNPVTGRLVSTADRLDQAVTSARQAERLGFDAVALGERHAGPFLSPG